MLKSFFFPYLTFRRNWKYVEEYLGSKDTYFRHYHLKNVLAFTCPDYSGNAKGICSSSRVWVTQQWICSVTPLRAAPKQSIKAEVGGMGVVPGTQCWPPFFCEEGSDGHCRGHGHLCPSAGWVRSQLGSQSLHLVREEVGLQGGLGVGLGNNDLGVQMKEGGLVGYLEAESCFGPYFCFLERKGLLKFSPMQLRCLVKLYRDEGGLLGCGEGQLLLAGSHMIWATLSSQVCER